MIIEMENYPKWNETNVGGTHFPLLWLCEEQYTPQNKELAALQKGSNRHFSQYKFEKSLQVQKKIEDKPIDTYNHLLVYWSSYVGWDTAIL